MAMQNLILRKGKGNEQGGSGTTAIACINTKRNFIGIEKEEKYYNIAKERINSIESKNSRT